MSTRDQPEARFKMDLRIECHSQSALFCNLVDFCQQRTTRFWLGFLCCPRNDGHLTSDGMTVTDVTHFY